MSVETETKKIPVKLTLKHMKVVAKWNYSTKNTECTLCHRDLLMPVQEVDVANKLNGDVTIHETCQYGFNTVCINSWLSHAHTECPNCQSAWKAAKNVGSSVYVYKST